MRILLILVLIGVAAYFTVPTRAAHEEAARAFLETYRPTPEDNVPWLQTMVGYAAGMLAGQGRYDTFVIASRYSVDAPGAAYVECWGAFTIVQCSEVAPGA